MHIAIDLGEEFSYLVCWETGREVEDTSIRVKIPGPGKYNSPAYSRAWTKTTLGDYLAYLHREYLLPSRKLIESAAVSVPDIWPLRARASLLQAMEEVMGLASAQIIPQPLALAAGHNLLNLGPALEGEVLLVQDHLPGLDMACLYISSAGGTILEKHFPATDPAGAGPEALPGYLAGDGCRFDSILIISPHSLPLFEKQLYPWAAEINYLPKSSMDFTAAEGLYLARTSSLSVPGCRLSIIYPYTFYLQVDSAQGSDRWQEIPFDTSNLELDCGGRYRLFNLDADLLGLGPNLEDRWRLSVYELPSQYRPEPSEHLPLGHRVWELDSASVPPELCVSLDMPSATLSLEIEAPPLVESGMSVQTLHTRLVSNRDRLLQELKTLSPASELVRDWEEHLHSNRAAHPDLAVLVQDTLFHLSALIRMWSE